MERVLITGTNRGIGLALVRQYLQRPQTQVIATCRQPREASALNALLQTHGERLTLVPLDVADAESLENAEHHIKAKFNALDILINNAAINPSGRFQTFESIEAENFLHILRVNAVAPLIVARTFVDLLKRSTKPRIINISSEMGSLAARNYGGDYGYCTSKAALNMITRGMAADLKSAGIVTISLDPGWVQTDMGGRGAPLTPEQSARGILTVVDGLTLRENGGFWRWDGKTHRW